MNPLRYWVVALFALFAAYPFLPFASALRGEQMSVLFIFGILALGLNVVLGNVGVLHLGMAAFFGIGAYTTGILTVSFLPFQQSFLVALVVSTLVAAAVGVVTTAPLLRLRGDYLALVTLGFGLITFYLIRNLDEITKGTQTLGPIEPGPLPGVSEAVDMSSFRFVSEKTAGADRDAHWSKKWDGYPYFYFLCLLALGATMAVLRNLERSRLGRAWVAIREDELAASCMGLNPARLKLSAIAIGSGLAGAAGALYTLTRHTTGNPQFYDFSMSMTMICCVILGGLGNRSGVLLGVLLLMGFDRIATNILDNMIQEAMGSNVEEYMKVSAWKLMIFGTVLIVMMRFRPEGLVPEARQARELHPEADEAVGEAAAHAEAQESGDTGPRPG